MINQPSDSYDETYPSDVSALRRIKWDGKEMLTSCSRDLGMSSTYIWGENYTLLLTLLLAFTLCYFKN